MPRLDTQLIKNSGYYSTAFPKHQQKDISGYLTKLWQSDPFKAKWSLLAKAYSVIRDNKGKDIVHLDQFLAISVSLIGIIKPEHYLQTMGWEIAAQENGQAMIKRYDTHLDERLFVTNFSVNDIIRHCYQQGFFMGNVAELLSSDNEVVMTMATSSQCTVASQLPKMSHVEGLGAQIAVNADSDNFEEVTYNGNHKAVTHKATENGDKDNNNTEAADNLAPVDKVGHSVETSNIVEEYGATAGSDHGYTAVNTTPAMLYNLSNTGYESVTNLHGDQAAEQQPISTWAAINPASALTASNFQITSSYPHNADFDPNLPGFVFDPFSGNQFDVFDMSDPSWNDVINFDDCI